MTWRRLVVVALLVGLPAGAWAAGRSSRSPEEAAALREPPPPGALTAEVESLVLTHEIVTRGTVESVGAVDVEIAPAGDTLPIVTGLPVEPGATLDEGGVVLEVAGRPVIMISGTFPMYRDLAVGDTGPDVEQLEVAVERLGYWPGAMDGRYDANLADAVRRVWQAAGYEPVLGAADPAPPPQPTGEEQAAPPADPPRYPMVPRAEVWVSPDASMVTTDVRISVGSQIDGPPLSMSSGSTQVVAEINAADAPLIRGGATVMVTDDLGGGSTRTGSVASEPESVSTPDGPASTVFRIAVDEPFEIGDVGRGVRVTVQVSTTDGPVLVVPLVAVHSTTGGRTRVKVVRTEGEELVEVEVGLVVDGLAEVTGDVVEGDLVRVG